MYVLLVISMVASGIHGSNGYPNQAAVVTMQEFSTLGRCEKAKEVIAHRVFSATCIPK